MRIAENPFWLLDMGMEDDQETVDDRVEELMDEDDSRDWRALGQALRKPKDRVACEVAWLPGVEPTKARMTVEYVLGKSVPRGNMIDNRYPLANVNTLLGKLERGEAEETAGMLLLTAQFWQRVDAMAVAQQINRHRSKAGIRARVTEDMVDEALVKHRSWMQDEVKAKLDAFPTTQMVDSVRELSESATEKGARRAPEAARDWIRMYERECGDYFKVQLEAVRKLIRQTERKVGQGDLVRARRLVERINEAMVSWDRVAQPVQLLHQGEGSVDPVSEEMFRTSREFAIKLHNELGLTQLSVMLVKTQKRVFVEVEKLAAQAETDEDLLQRLLAGR